MSIDHSAYDRRDALQRCAAFLGFTFLVSWSVWSALWAPGVSRSPIAAQLIMAAGFWGPALAARFSARLYRPRQAGEQDETPIESAPWRFFLGTTLLTLAIVAIALGMAFALGHSSWQWTWMGSGWPLVFGGQAASMSIEVYDLVNYIALIVQTIFVETAIWFTLLIVVACGEIGWRGAFLPGIVSTGQRRWRAALFAGFCYGVWLWPLVWRGNLTGFYAGAAWWGMFAAVWFGMGWGLVFGWIYFRHERIGPVIAASAWMAWAIYAVPKVSSPFDMFLWADPRSLATSSLAAVVGLTLWRFFPHSATREAILPEEEG